MKRHGFGMMAIAILAACTTGPEPIRWGTDTCEQCRMILEDRRFGAELVAGGRTYKFDGIDELGLYMTAHPGAGTPYVVDASSGALIKAEQAVLLASPELRGPMGGHVVAFDNKEAASHFAAQAHLKVLQWPSLADALRLATKGNVHERR